MEPSGVGGAWADRTLQRREDGVVSRDDDGRMVILDTRSGLYLTLNESGGLIWSALRQPLTIVELESRLTSAYDVSPAEAATAVRDFLDSLEKRDLLLNDEGRI